MKTRADRQNSLSLKLAIAALAATTLLAACTSGKQRNFDFPEPPIRRGSF